MRPSSIITFLSLAVLPVALASPINDQDSAIAKRCCILCDNPYSRCGANDKRESVQTEEEVFQGPEKRCCVNCDVNRCGN